MPEEILKPRHPPPTALRGQANSGDHSRGGWGGRGGLLSDSDTAWSETGNAAQSPPAGLSFPGRTYRDALVKTASPQAGWAQDGSLPAA